MVAMAWRADATLPIPDWKVVGAALPAGADDREPADGQADRVPHQVAAG